MISEVSHRGVPSRSYPRRPIVILNEIVAAGTILSSAPGASLDPTALLSGFDIAREIRGKLCLLFPKRPTPCARTYANSASEVSREMTLIAETALCSHVGERKPVIAQLFLG